ASARRSGRWWPASSCARPSRPPDAERRTFRPAAEELSPSGGMPHSGAIHTVEGMSELQLSGITKSYGERRVLEDVSFSVAPGHLTGFIGGNGAGKTTTMRIILGLLSSDGGE